jgi:hypothetical protein
MATVNDSESLFSFGYNFRVFTELVIRFRDRHCHIIPKQTSFTECASDGMLFLFHLST